MIHGYTWQQFINLQHKDPLTLEQFIAKETERKANQITTTTGFIQKLNERKAEASDNTEKNRLQDLINLHTSFLAEVNAWNVTALATEKFNKQQERLDKRPKRDVVVD